MNLADWIIENGPFYGGDPVPDALRYPDYIALNDLRDELIAGRQAVEDLRERREREERA